LTKSDRASVRNLTDYLWWAGSLVIVLFFALRAVIFAPDLAELGAVEKLGALTSSARENTAFVLAVILAFHLAIHVSPGKTHRMVFALTTGVFVLISRSRC
jgi:hypothetical protein